MEVKDLSWDSTTERSNHKLLPKTVRGLIVGKSGCGKTTLTESVTKSRMVGFQ